MKTYAYVYFDTDSNVFKSCDFVPSKLFVLHVMMYDVLMLLRTPLLWPKYSIHDVNDKTYWCTVAIFPGKSIKLC